MVAGRGVGGRKEGGVNRWLQAVASDGRSCCGRRSAETGEGGGEK